MTSLVHIKYSVSFQREFTTFTRFFLHLFCFIASTVNSEPSGQSLNYKYCGSLITASHISFERVVTVSNIDSTLLIRLLKKIFCLWQVVYYPSASSDVGICFLNVIKKFPNFSITLPSTLKVLPTFLYPLRNVRYMFPFRTEEQILITASKCSTLNQNSQTLFSIIVFYLVLRS